MPAASVIPSQDTPLSSHSLTFQIPPVEAIPLTLQKKCNSQLGPQHLWAAVSYWALTVIYSLRDWVVTPFLKDWDSERLGQDRKARRHCFGKTCSLGVLASLLPVQAQGSDRWPGEVAHKQTTLMPEGNALSPLTFLLVLPTHPQHPGGKNANRKEHSLLHPLFPTCVCY